MRIAATTVLARARAQFEAGEENLIVSLPLCLPSSLSSSVECGLEEMMYDIILIGEKDDHRYLL
jgi:hypothetical protein